MECDEAGLQLTRPIHDSWSLYVYGATTGEMGVLHSLLLQESVNRVMEHPPCPGDAPKAYPLRIFSRDPLPADMDDLKPEFAELPQVPCDIASKVADCWQELTGGFVSKPYYAQHRPAWSWSALCFDLNYGEAADLLEALRPYRCTAEFDYSTELMDPLAIADTVDSHQAAHLLAAQEGWCSPDLPALFTGHLAVDVYSKTGDIDWAGLKARDIESLECLSVFPLVTSCASSASRAAMAKVLSQHQRVTYQRTDIGNLEVPCRFGSL